MSCNDEYLPPWTDAEKALFVEVRKRYLQLIDEGVSPDEAQQIAHREAYGDNK